MPRPVGRPPLSNAAALKAARQTRNHALWERNRLLLLWIQSSQLVAHLEPPSRPDLLFPAVLCVHTPVGQLTWKLSLEDVEDFAHLPSNGVSHFDGARSGEKDQRLQSLVTLAIGPPRAASADDGCILGGCQLTFEQYGLVKGMLSEALAEKPGSGTYAAFVSPNGAKVRLTRYLPKFIEQLPKDHAGRAYDPSDGWLYAGTLTK